MRREVLPWVVLVAALVSLVSTGSNVIGQTARLVDVVAIAGSGTLVGVSMVQLIQARRAKHR